MTTRYWFIAISAILVLGATGFWLTREEATVKQALPAKLQCELPPSSAAAPKPGMVWIPDGVFDMGDSVYPEEKPVRNVRVKGFWMDRTEVTNAEFSAFVKATGYVTVAERPVNPQLVANLPEDMRKPGAVVFKVPAQLTHGDDPRQWWQYIPGANWKQPAGPHSNIDNFGQFPAVHITYEDAQAYAQWKGHRLPTEAEWEYTCRAGTTTPFFFGDNITSEQVNFDGNYPYNHSPKCSSKGETMPVGSYPPNSWGVYDMHGNVWEWCQDESHDHYRNAPADGSAWQASSTSNGNRSRVLRGGAWNSTPANCRSAFRNGYFPDSRFDRCGFRIAFSI
jgi:formylglycine-generating enzyme required for sulfatase activity